MSTETFHYRPLFGRILTGAVLVICAAGLVGFALTGDTEDLVRAAWPLLFFSALVIALFWRPEITIRPDAVEVVNVFSTITVPWPAIERIDTRYTLTLYTATRKVPVWAAPAPGIRGAVAIERSDVRNLNESAYGPGHSVRPGDATSSPSGQVAFVLRQRWEALRDAGFLDSGAVEEGTLRVRTHGWTIAILATLLLASVVGAVL